MIESSIKQEVLRVSHCVYTPPVDSDVIGPFFFSKGQIDVLTHRRGDNYSYSFSNGADKVCRGAGYG